MNKESYDLMASFVAQNVDPNKKTKILDVGSYSVNGDHKGLFNNPNWEYVGLDIEPGPNVNVVAVNEYDFGLPDENFDVVISSNVAEHVRDIFAWIKEIARVTKKGGIICIITPSRIDEHRFPLDCWRIMPDGLVYMFQVAKLYIVRTVQIDYHTSFRFTVGIARK